MTRRYPIASGHHEIVARDRLMRDRFGAMAGGDAKTGAMRRAMKKPPIIFERHRAEMLVQNTDAFFRVRFARAEESPPGRIRNAQAENPPSTAMTWPEMKDADSDARNRTRGITSSGTPSLPAGVRRMTC